MSREEIRTYLIRRQRKEVLQEVRRPAVMGVGGDAACASRILTEKLLSYGVEICPVIPGCQIYLCL